MSPRPNEDSLLGQKLGLPGSELKTAQLRPVERLLPAPANSEEAGMAPLMGHPTKRVPFSSSSHVGTTP